MPATDTNPQKLPKICIFNTLSGKKEALHPLKPGIVSMYACGVTTYDHYHIGHALQAIYFDMICSFLRYVGYKVVYVRNYTDVDDKIINRAKELGISPKKLAENIIQSSEEDMEALGCTPPDFAPRVSQSIQEIIAMTEDLVKSGFAYVCKSGDVYYRVREKKDYGKLSNRRVDELKSGTRDLVEGEKQDELDFALWKKDETPDASWESPWGRGRPGWHIECSAMSKKHLGPSFDIHGGGRDLVFPHHENEIAQSEAANSCAYATYWIHCGLLTIEKQKMSKSLGNHIRLKDFLSKWPAESLRLAYLQYHYGSNIDFQNDTFKNAIKRLYYYYQTLAQLDQAAKQNTDTKLPPSSSDQILVDDIRKRFVDAMSDDFNSALALGDLNLHFRKANELLAGGKITPEKSTTAGQLANILREVFGVFGMLQKNPTDFLEELKERLLPDLGITRNEIEAKIIERRQARVEKNFQLADKIRVELAAKCIELMDTPTGTTWKIRYDS